MSISHSDRLGGGLIGLLVGDALGVPYEFHEARKVPHQSLIEFAPPCGFDRSHSRVAPGTYSDDGSQALCLLESLLRLGKFDIEDFSRGLLRWQSGDFWVDGEVFDMGIQTSLALQALERGVSPWDSGPGTVDKNGNGSLMRCLPIALMPRTTEAQLIADAHAQSLPTHGHERSQVACALYCLWADNELRGQERAFEAAISRLAQFYSSGQNEPRWRFGEREHYREELRLITDYTHHNGSGYVVDSLRSAEWAISQSRDFESSVKLAVSLGDDTDTTAAVTGGIAGLRYGLGGIPERWRQSLRGKEIFDPLVSRLLATIG